MDRGRSGIAAVARQVERAFTLLDEAAGARDVAPEGGVPRLVDRQFAVAELDVRTFFALEAADRLVLARDVERTAIAEVEIGRMIDRPADSHRTAVDWTSTRITSRHKSAYRLPSSACE